MTICSASACGSCGPRNCGFEGRPMYTRHWMRAGRALVLISGAGWMVWKVAVMS